MHVERLGGDYVGQRWPELTKGAKDPLSLLDWPRITNEEGYYGLAMDILR